MTLVYFMLAAVVAWCCEHHERHIERAGTQRAPRVPLPRARVL